MTLTVLQLATGVVILPTAAAILANVVVAKYATVVTNA